jgi:wobble nucleotide-excising tRNase
MLKKIISIKNVGRFISSALPGVPTCAKYTQILGANGYGKTTICSILRSLGTDDPGLIAGRARIGSKTQPQIELLLDAGSAKFENGAWSAPAPEFLVFDGAFIVENVHSGDAVDLAQKRNLYRVIIGKEGVGLAVEEERVAAESRSKGADIKAAERAIQTHVPQGMSVEFFLTLPADPDIDAKIATQTTALNAVQEADQLRARAPLIEAAFPTLSSDFTALLGKTIDGIAEDAQKRIADHISQHGMAAHGEKWISEGVDHMAGGSCPFCGQPLKGIALIEAYLKVFGDVYRQMQSAVAEMQTTVEHDFGDRVAGSLETLFESNRSAAGFWSGYCKLPELHPHVRCNPQFTHVR